MRRFVWLLLLIVFVAFIFYNSSMPAAESHRASELVGSILTGMGKWFGIDVPQQNLDYNIRKLAHFLEFAILGVILCNVYAAFGVSQIKKTPEKSRITSVTKALRPGACSWIYSSLTATAKPKNKIYPVDVR